MTKNPTLINQFIDKSIGIFIFTSIVNAETVLLKCEFTDGKLLRYKNNKAHKTEELNNPRKELEIKLDLTLNTVKQGPGIGYGTKINWNDDFIFWISDSSVSGPYDSLRMVNLNRFTGKLTMSNQSLERVIEDGHYQKDDNGNWIRNIQWKSSSEYQCRKQDKLF